MERRDSRVLYEVSPPIDPGGTQEKSHGVLSRVCWTASPQISDQGGGEHILFSSHEHQIRIINTVRPDSELSRKGNWEKL